MSSDLLSQDEIDALLHGVDSGAVETQPEPAPGEARQYDFASQDRIVRGKLPTLEMINERFARTLRIGIYNLLHRSAELSVKGIDLLRFGEYMHSLQVPTNLNLVKMTASILSAAASCRSTCRTSVSALACSRSLPLR